MTALCTTQLWEKYPFSSFLLNIGTKLGSKRPPRVTAPGAIVEILALPPSNQLWRKTYPAPHLLNHHPDFFLE